MNSNSYNVGVGLTIPGVSVNFPQPKGALSIAAREGRLPIVDRPPVMETSVEPPSPVAPQVTEPVVITPPATTNTMTIVGVVAAVAAVTFGAYYYMSRG